MGADFYSDSLLAPQYQILVDREKDKLDALEIRVEAAAEYFDPVDTSRLDDLRARAQAALLQSLGVSARVELVGPRQIERSEGKARRVIDKRETWIQLPSATLQVEKRGELL